MKIAIIGAGPAGLACALECERLGVAPDVFERNYFLDWIWPSTSLFLNIFEPQMGGDIIQYLKNEYNINLKAISKWTELIIKGPTKEVKVTGNLGYCVSRGAIQKDALCKQLRSNLNLTTIHYNRPSDYKVLSRKYDYVVVATDSAKDATELGVWEECGEMDLFGGIAIGKFNVNSTSIYYNTEYAGHGYARLTPLNSTHAIVGVGNTGNLRHEMPKLFDKFLECEDLTHLKFIYTFYPPRYFAGRVKKFQVNNVLLVGRAAGLDERFMGSGVISALISGVLAARAMIMGKDYETLIQPVRTHVENISAIRKPFEKLNNDGLDKLIGVLEIPGIKQITYNLGINLVDRIGGLLRLLSSIASNG